MRKLWYQFRNLRIVKFDDGNYAVRKGWFFFQYLVLGAENNSWLALWSIKYAKSTCINTVGRRFDSLLSGKNYGTPIEVERIYKEVAE